MSNEYASPQVLVSTDWVDKNRGKTDKIRIAESDEDVLLFETGTFLKRSRSTGSTI